MKKSNYIKHTLFHSIFAIIILLFSSFLLSSCNNSQKPEDTRAMAEGRDDRILDNNENNNNNHESQEKDAKFLVSAAEINLEEIQLGQLAQQNGKTTQVKELGKRMEEAHTKSLNDLSALAKSKMITIPTMPTEDARDAYKELNEKSGEDFDKEYADMMVKDHKDAIDAFEKASSDSEDREIKNWATVSLPNLRTHLEHSIACQKDFAEMYLKKNN